MTRKIEDLEDFCLMILDKGFKEIGLHNLRFEISKHFGYSKYIHDSTFKALVDYDFVRDIGHGHFAIEILKTKEDRKKEAEAELKNLGIE